MITLRYESGYVHASWGGTLIGSFEYVSGGMLSGSALYKRGWFDTESYSQYGIPDHSVREKLTLLCQLQDSLDATGKAA